MAFLLEPWPGLGLWSMTSVRNPAPAVTKAVGTPTLPAPIMMMS